MEVEVNRDIPTAPPPPPPWLELPPEITTAILQKLRAVDILKNVELVCKTWRRLCLEPSMWRVIDMQHVDADLWSMEDLEDTCRRAVDRSQGQLIDINIEYCASDSLLDFIAQRSPQLKRLRIVCFFNYDISGEGLSEAVKKFPLLEELHLYYTSIPKEAIVTIGRSCPMLKSFKLHSRPCRYPYIDYDDEAIAIAENMPELRHLQLFGNKMTNEGLAAILNGCVHLESLDLRQCFNLDLEGDLWKRCCQHIKDLRKPNDPTNGYEVAAEMNDYESFDDDYPPGFSDIDLVSDADDDHYEFSDDDEDMFFD